MVDPDDLFAEFNGDPEAVAAELTIHPRPDDHYLRQACHFTKAFARDGQWCEERWANSTEYYCGACRQHNRIR